MLTTDDLSPVGEPEPQSAEPVGAEIKPGRIYRVKAHCASDVRTKLQVGWKQKGRVSGPKAGTLNADEEIGPIEKWREFPDQANVILELPNGRGYVNTHKPAEMKVVRGDYKKVLIPGKETLQWVNKERAAFDGDWKPFDWMKDSDELALEAGITKREENEAAFKQRLARIESQMNQDVAV